MKFIKKNKTLLLAGLILIAIVAAIFIVKDTIMFDEYQALYGNRLEGIDKVQVTNDQIKQVKERLKETTEKVDVRVSGRVINLIIETKPETTPEEARGMAGVLLEIITPEQKSYFDIEALIDNSENQNQFPIIGYMHKSKDVFTWTRDR